MTDRELMQQALDALDLVTDLTSYDDEVYEAIDALRARLAQPEQEIESDQDHVEDDGCPTEKAVLQRFWREHQKQEPVACPYCHYSHTLGAVFFDQNCAGCVNRMTAPPQREWQGLTENEISRKPPTQDLSAPLTVNGVPMYPQREWQTLTDEEMFSLWVRCPAETEDRFAFARAIEAKLKEMNT